MPRPERPVDPSAGPVQQFAADLRKLRVEAGNPPYREMAKHAHASKASLSAAASGHRLPTWEVTQGYVQACGGPVEAWHDRWLTVRAQVGPPLDPGLPADSAPAGSGLPADARSSVGSGTPAARRGRWAVLVGAVAAALLLAGALTLWGVTRGPAGTDATPLRPDPEALVASTSPQPTARFPGSGGEAVQDDADPKKSGCADDPASIRELDRVQVNTLNENLLGVAVLRHAPQCHASWGRFEPSDRLTFLSGPVRITITAHRPATGTVGTAYTTAFDGQPVFGNILLDTTGCVEVTVRVDAPDGGGESTTHCKRGPQ
ncbi:hypothetical protein [Actinoplanes awajinensis]|uniref:HTH cro/C1-type domain-containing protein n=1 Tax=Actinoplanes awajinensis subsp. mycoplanecinus TaxID=135947 RepID=A0A0X3UYF7_9ACTN|nr:hypothetical protein [Actinoplanes awajinensis]KUL37520.1 hypothetical protein ADL15_11750 [Actinoplanes awajinensis subsp. mycoplanecinus]